MKKNNKNSIQNLVQRKKTFFKSVKSQFSLFDKKLYLSAQISHSKSILFCTWHPRKLWGYYSNSYSLNYLVEKNGNLETNEIFNQTSIHNKNKKNVASYEITSIEFNLIGTLISTAFYNGFFVIWTETGIPLSKIFFLNRALIEAKWSESSRTIALLYLSGEIEIWSSWYSNTLLMILPHRSLSVSFEWKETICLFAFSKDKIFSKINLLKKQLNIIRAHCSQINDLAYSSEKEMLGSCSDDLTIKLWDSKRLKFLITLEGHQKEVLVLNFKPRIYQKKCFLHKWFIISGSLDFSLRIWDSTSKKCLRFFKFDGPLLSIEWVPDSKKIIVGASDKIWTLESNEIKNELNQLGTAYSIFSLTSHPMVNKTMGFSYKTIFTF